MRIKILFGAGLALVLAAGSCERDAEAILSSGYPGRSFTTERIDDTQVTIDGETYTVRQNKIIYSDGGTPGLGWAVVTKDGKIISCRTPTPQGCKAALALDAQGAARDEGGMY